MVFSCHGNCLQFTTGNSLEEKKASDERCCIIFRIVRGFFNQCMMLFLLICVKFASSYFHVKKSVPRLSTKYLKVNPNHSLFSRKSNYRIPEVLQNQSTLIHAHNEFYMDISLVWSLKIIIHFHIKFQIIVKLHIHFIYYVPTMLIIFRKMDKFSWGCVTYIVPLNSKSRKSKR